MPYFVQNVDPKLKWYQEMGRTQGHVANLLLQAMIAQQTGGGGAFAPKNIPNPGYGQTGSPGTTFSQPPPGMLSPPQNPQQVKQGYRPPITGSPYASQPMLNKQQFETLQSLQTYQQNAAKAPIELKALEALAAQRSQPNQVLIGYGTEGNPIFSPVPGKLAGGRPPSSEDELTKALALLVAQGTTPTVPASSAMKKPGFVDQADWDKATDEQKQALLKRLGL